MKAQRKSPRKLWMQLEELLLAMCIGAAVTGAAVELGVRSWRYCRDSMTCAESCQDMILLAGAWRDFIHGCETPPLLNRPHSTDTDTEACCATIKDNQLVLDNHGNRRTVMLPAETTVTMTREHTPEGTPLYILTLNHSPDVAPQGAHARTRIVACRPEKPTS